MRKLKCKQQLSRLNEAHSTGKNQKVWWSRMLYNRARTSRGEGGVGLDPVFILKFAFLFIVKVLTNFDFKKKENHCIKILLMLPQKFKQNYHIPQQLHS